MLYSADFKDMSGKVKPVEMAKYLHDLGWSTIPTKREHVNIFQLSSGNDFYQINLPTDKSLSDYNIAMYRAIETLAASSKKSIEQVLLELLNPLSDILRFRISGNAFETGSIYVEDAINLYSNGRKMLAAAAMDAISPKLFHTGKPDSKVQELVSRSRYGQTEIGSYVVSLVCPFANVVDGEYAQLTLFDDEEMVANSLTRKVTRKLISSAQEVKTAVENGTLEKLVICESPTISANFLEAVNAIGLQKRDCHVEIAAKWAPTVRANTPENNAVSLTHDYYSPIAAVVNKIKSFCEEEKGYVGRITKLVSIENAPKRKNGQITIAYINENGKRSTASTNLSRYDYDRAIEAHKKGEMVRVVGKLSAKTIECTAFDIIA